MVNAEAVLFITYALVVLVAAHNDAVALVFELGAVDIAAAGPVTRRGGAAERSAGAALGGLNDLVGRGLGSLGGGRRRGRSVAGSSESASGGDGKSDDGGELHVGC